MCTTTSPARDKTVTPRAKVYIDGKNRPLYVEETVESIGLMLNQGGALAVTNIYGERQVLNAARVISAGPVRQDTPIEPHDLDGVKYSFHGERGPDRGDNIEVLAEDMAEVRICLIDRATGAVSDVNPAVPDEAIAKLVKATRLIREAEALTTAANHVEITPDQAARLFPVGARVRGVALNGDTIVGVVVDVTGEYRDVEIDGDPHPEYGQVATFHQDNLVLAIFPG